MWKTCKLDNEYVIDNFKHGKLDHIAMSSSHLVDDIILSMNELGVIDCLDINFDKRKMNKLIPVNILIVLAIASKMKVKTSLTDIPFAIQDHRVLSKLGYNLINSNIEENGIMTEGSLRFFINKFITNDFIEYYNNVLYENIMKKLDIYPNIHILDCTKIKVNFDNKNYENSSIAYDYNNNRSYRGYKLSSLRGIIGDVGIVEEIRFDTASTHDLTLSENMLKTTKCLKHGDILIMDRGFISRELINYLKTNRNIDTYIPLKKNMTAYEEAITIAKKSNNWTAHPNKKRNKQLIAFVSNLKLSWISDNPNEDVDFNACVVWHTDVDKYSVFITTDLSKSAKEIVLTYEIRPEIEEDFRQLKDFWKLEDFKSTKENFIAFHIICTLLGYLFYNLYMIFDEEGYKLIGKSLPIVLKNYQSKSLCHFVIYYKDCFAVISFHELLKIFGSCNKNVQDVLLNYFK